MSEPLSERVFSAIAQQLELIRLENGYLTDAGFNVFRGRRTFAVADLPAISVSDAGETPDGGEASNGASMRMRQRIAIEIHALADQDDTGLIIGKMKADVKRCVFTWAPNGGMTDCINGVSKKLGLIVYTGADPTARQDGGESEFVAMNFEATYMEGYGDPTTSL
jgi:hypothetical protein